LRVKQTSGTGGDESELRSEAKKTIFREHKASMEFDDHKAAYLAAAQEVVGARLGGKAKPRLKGLDTLRHADD